MKGAIELAGILVELYRIGVQHGVDYDTIGAYASAYSQEKSCKPFLYKSDAGGYLDCMRRKQDACLQKVSDTLEFLIHEERNMRKD